MQSPCTVTLNSHDFTRGADAKSNGELSAWVINSGEFPTTQQKPMLVAHATEIAPDDLTAGIDPVNIG